MLWRAEIRAEPPTSVHVGSLSKLSHWHGRTDPHLGSPGWGEQHSQLWGLRSRGSVGRQRESLAELPRGRHAPVHCGKWAANPACSGSPLVQRSKGRRGGFGASSGGAAAVPRAPPGPQRKGLFAFCHGQFSSVFHRTPKSGRGSESSLAPCHPEGKELLELRPGSGVWGRSRGGNGWALPVSLVRTGLCGTEGPQ